MCVCLLSLRHETFLDLFGALVLCFSVKSVFLFFLSSKSFVFNQCFIHKRRLSFERNKNKIEIVFLFKTNNLHTESAKDQKKEIQTLHLGWNTIVFFFLNVSNFISVQFSFRQANLSCNNTWVALRLFFFLNNNLCSNKKSIARIRWSWGKGQTNAAYMLACMREWRGRHCVHLHLN